MKNTLLLILFGLFLTSCAALFTPPEEMERPDPETEENPGPGGTTDFVLTYTYGEKCRDLDSVQCTINISGDLGESASESLRCGTEFESCTATIQGGITGSCDAGAPTPKTDDDFTVVVSYNSELNFPPTLRCYSGT